MQCHVFGEYRMRRSAGQTVRIQAARAQTLSTQTVPMPLPEQTPPDAASSAELEACLGADVGAGPCEFLLTASEEERRAWQLVARTLSTLLASHGHHAGQVVPPLTMPTPSTLLSGAEPPTTLEQLVYLLAGALLQLVLQGEAEAEQRRAGKMARVATRVAADVAANVARAIAGQVTHAALGSVRVGTPRAEWYAVLPHATPSVPVRGATLTAR